MIGIFDSGAGGLSVWKEIIASVPQEKIIYISDSAFCPYGPKNPDQVIARSIKISQYLIDKGADIIVVACNTATAAAIQTLREKFAIPIVGMEPAIKPAAFSTKSKVIGVLATKGTFKGELYLNTSKLYTQNIKVIEQIGEGLVELVEEGAQKTPRAEELIRKYIEPMIQEGADNIVLGCTHYPFLSGVIEKVTQGKVRIINPAPAVAKRVMELYTPIKSKVEREERKNKICTTGSSYKVLKSLANEILKELKDKEILTESQLQPFLNQKYETIKI